MNLNLRYVMRQLGLVLGVLSACMLLVLLFQTARYYGGAPLHRDAVQAIGVTIGIGCAVAVILWFVGQYRMLEVLGRREALLLVALTWLLGAVLAGLPYWVWACLTQEADAHPFASPISCYFEAMSGLTTTGATVLRDTHSIPPTLLLWRAMTHWLGGLGIVVLFVAVLPTLGVGGKKLFQIESGIEAAGVRPRIRQTARLLWSIYLGLTVIQIIALHLAGLTWFDSICHTFATLATGGFSTENASIGYYQSPVIECIVMLFMMLGGINFGLYYYILQRRPRRVWRDPELRAFLVILLAMIAIVTISLTGTTIVTTTGEKVAGGFGQSVRFAAFQVISIHTTTGFATADFNQWPLLAKAVLVLLMFFGATAGSTSGGIKLIRILIAGKVMISDVERVYRPRVIRTIRLGSRTIDLGLRQGVLIYIMHYLMLFALAGTVLLLIEPAARLDVTSAFTASVVTLSNVGPGLGAVGAVENYSFFSAPSKLLLSLLMCLGRLELYAIFVLLAPRFWRGD